MRQGEGGVTEEATATVREYQMVKAYVGNDCDRDGIERVLKVYFLLGKRA